VVTATAATTAAATATATTTSTTTATTLGASQVTGPTAVATAAATAAVVTAGPASEFDWSHDNTPQGVTWLHIDASLYTTGAAIAVINLCCITSDVLRVKYAPPSEGHLSLMASVTGLVLLLSHLCAAEKQLGCQ
jgi:hypothetical protein